VNHQGSRAGKQSATAIAKCQSWSRDLMLLKPQLMIVQRWFLSPCYKTPLSRGWYYKYWWGLL